MTIKSAYIYLQRPDDGNWVTVGRLDLHPGFRAGYFRYAPSYLETGLPWAIDPLNLPFKTPTYRYVCGRHQGLHDVLRDTCPDAWGRSLLQREHGLSVDAHDLEVLLLSSNQDRWGALKIGRSAKPDKSNANSPRISSIGRLLEELALMASGQPAKYGDLRKRLTTTVSIGGARPKLTVFDGDRYLLAKPRTLYDSTDVPMLEHATMLLASRSGLRVAVTRHEQVHAHSVVLVERFDRRGDRRHMVISGASLLEVEYPARRNEDKAGWSYPLLAAALHRIGVPVEDRQELFLRMVFNALTGNDDDHPRNHAAIYVHSEQRWRLSPAFDLVPSTEIEPDRLAMQLSGGEWKIGRQAILAGWQRFGFDSLAAAEHAMDAFVARVLAETEGILPLLPTDQRGVLPVRVRRVAGLLSSVNERS